MDVDNDYEEFNFKWVLGNYLLQIGIFFLKDFKNQQPTVK